MCYAVILLFITSSWHSDGLFISFKRGIVYPGLNKKPSKLSSPLKIKVAVYCFFKTGYVCKCFKLIYKFKTALIYIYYYSY